MRTVTTPPKNDGQACPALTQQVPCDVDCVVSSWTNSGSCDSSTGLQDQVRTVTTPPKNDGQACPALTQQVPCDVDCVVSDWGAWSTCDQTGHKSHNRSVVVTPKNNGLVCPSLVETDTCVPCSIATSDDYYCAKTTSTVLTVLGYKGVLANDHIKGGIASVVMISSPAQGAVLFNETDGSFVYTPPACKCFKGVVTFQYQVTDNCGDTSISTVTIAVGCCVPNPDIMTGCGVFGPKYVSCNLKAGNNVTNCVLPCGLGTVPVPNVANKTKAKFAFRVKVHRYFTKNIGRKLATTPSAQSCFVTAADDYYCAFTERPLVVSAANGVLSNDTSSCANTTATLLTQPIRGSVAMNADGSFTYIPIGCHCFNGIETFTYKVDDGNGNTAVGTVTLYVGNNCPAWVGNPLYFGCGVSLPKSFMCTLGSGATTTCDTSCPTLGSFVVPNIAGKSAALLTVTAKVVSYT